MCLVKRWVNPTLVKVRYKRNFLNIFYLFSELSRSSCHLVAVIIPAPLLKVAPQILGLSAGTSIQKTFKKVVKISVSKSPSYVAEGRRNYEARLLLLH